MKLPRRAPELPALLQRRHSDEFLPPAYTSREWAVIARVAARGPESARRLGISLADYWSTRPGTAAGVFFTAWLPSHSEYLNIKAES